MILGMDIACPHCGKQLKAPAAAAGRMATCKHCQGRFQVPAPTAALVPAVTEGTFEKPPNKGKLHVVTEKTSKRYKLMQLVGVAIILVSFLAMLVAYSATVSDATDASRSNRGSMAAGLSVIGLLVGFCVTVVGRVLAWWHHG